MEATAAAARWAEVWADAWPAGDVEAVAALYADDALFASAPFRERQAPREYVAWAFADQRTAECRFGTPLVAGDRAAVDWWAVVVDRAGSAETLAGASFLRFDAKGAVVEQRDVWSSAAGRHDVAGWAAG